MHLAIVTGIPVREWMEEYGRDPRVVVTALELMTTKPPTRDADGRLMSG